MKWFIKRVFLISVVVNLAAAVANVAVGNWFVAPLWVVIAAMSYISHVKTRAAALQAG